MTILDIVILLAVGAAFAAVVLRLRRKGACGACSNAGACHGSCTSCSTAQRACCPALKDADELHERLAHGVDAPRSSE